jgi:hypothetical protein
MRAVLRNVELAPTQKLIEIKTVFSKISDEISSFNKKAGKKT